MLDLIEGVRFAGDLNGAQELLRHEELSPFIERHSGPEATGAARKGLLSSAVRVDEHIIPSLGASINDLHERAGIEEEFECYVSAAPMINACVFRSNERFIVILSSAAVENLTPEELTFVIGHELGHVAYDHLEIPVGAILNEPDITPKHAMRLFAWQRQTEISADRVGLVCCGSLDTAVSAFFKTVSGLSTPNLRVNPHRFADQFDHLKEELHRQGVEDMRFITHPLPPLRAKAMSLFWETNEARQVAPDAPGGSPLEKCELKVQNLLAHMDPRGLRGDSDIDPMLAPYLTWGGMYIAGSDGKVDRTELEALKSVIGPSALEDALKAPRDIKEYLSRFKKAFEDRRQPLSALDIGRVLECFIAIVRADGVVDQGEVKALKQLAKIMRVPESYAVSLLDDE